MGLLCGVVGLVYSSPLLITPGPSSRFLLTNIQFASQGQTAGHLVVGCYNLVLGKMATTPNTLSPLPSRTEGLGIFPSGDSFSRNSGYSCGHTRSSTCTVLSYAQQFDQENTPPRAGITRTTTVRTNLKEIQKSPLPHRFNLVPSSRKQALEQPSQIPRSSTQCVRRRGQGGGESDRHTASPSLYALSSVRATAIWYIEYFLIFLKDTQSAQFAEDRNEDKRTILEDLLSDALDSPVFDCISTFSPPCSPSPQPQMVSPPSFTLVQDQPNNKSQQYSTKLDSIHELRTSANPPQSPIDRDRTLSSAFPSPRTPSVASHRGGTQFYEDFAQESPAIPQDVFSSSPEDEPQSAAIHHQSSEHPKSWQTILSASSSSKDFFICGDPDTSNSTYSQASLQNSFEAAIGRGFPASSRRATQGSFGSLTSSDSRRRKFAMRRQAIYAEYGFKLAFPESESSSSIRHTHIPMSSSRDFAEAASSRAASAYVDSRSVWSASTSAASIRSQLQHDVVPDPTADEVDDEPRDLDQLILPYPSARSLANLSNVERFSVQDAFFSPSRNPLLDDDHADIMTSTPPAKPRSQTQHPASLNRITRLASLPEVEAPLPIPGEHLAKNGHVYACGLEWRPWSPLRLPGIVSEDGGCIIRRSSSALERAQMFAKWQDDPGHHAIIQQLLDVVDLAIREWGGGLFAIGKCV